MILKLEQEKKALDNLLNALFLKIGFIEVLKKCKKMYENLEDIDKVSFHSGFCASAYGVFFLLVKSF